MHSKRSSNNNFIIIVIAISLFSCKNAKHPPGSDMANSPEQLVEKTANNIQKTIEFAIANGGDIGDSVLLDNARLAQLIYEKNQFASLWGSKESWKPAGDSLLKFIRDAKLYGLFPEDYHFALLDSVNKKFLLDSLGKTFRNDAALWAKADVLLTDAFLRIVRDVKLGHLPNDSVFVRKDSVLSDSFYTTKLDEILQRAAITETIAGLEPRHEGYHLLKAGIKKFLDSADYRIFTKVPTSKDPAFKKILQTRLYEAGYIAFDSTQADSSQLVAAIKKFQKQKSITVDGVAGEGTIRLLNTSDADRFVRIVITLDRYKLLPSKLPDQYIWVNLPSFYLKLQDKDTVKLVSKIVCGKAITRTPILTSSISELITYPQWTIPTSIIVKEILPAVKRNPGYLSKKGFSLIDSKGNEVDPYSVNWSKYNKGIPYKVVQGSGDANALGVLKFNFPNKYAVYLHDTNQRYLFGVPVRTLSHGCVRVQEWEKLATYIIRRDRPEVDGKVAMLDSMNSWLSRKEKHSIPIRNRLPVYIRYFTCEGKATGIVFYDDIYGEDKMIRAKYYAGK